MADLDAIEPWIAGLIESLDDRGRRDLARKLAILMRRGQADRIARQQNPDGTPYAPRKPRLRARAGTIRRRADNLRMFRKLRQAKYLLTRIEDDGVAVGFTGTTARIALVHQRGLRDRVSRESNAPEVTYSMRQLLGWSADDRAAVMDAVLAHLD